VAARRCERFDGAAHELERHEGDRGRGGWTAGARIKLGTDAFSNDLFEAMRWAIAMSKQIVPLR